MSGCLYCLLTLIALLGCCMSSSCNPDCLCVSLIKYRIYHLPMAAELSINAKALKLRDYTAEKFSVFRQHMNAHDSSCAIQYTPYLMLTGHNQLTLLNIFNLI